MPPAFNMLQHKKWENRIMKEHTLAQILLIIDVLKRGGYIKIPIVYNRKHKELSIKYNFKLVHILGRTEQFCIKLAHDKSPIYFVAQDTCVKTIHAERELKELLTN